LFGANFDVIRPSEGPPTGKPLSVDIFGEDLNEMSHVITDMKRLMRSTPGTVKPTDDAVTAQPTLEWRVDKARAGVLGLDQATISSILQIAVGGLETGTLGHGEDEQDIMLRLPERYRLNTELLKNITIPVSTLAQSIVPVIMASRIIKPPIVGVLRLFCIHSLRAFVLNSGTSFIFICSSQRIMRLPKKNVMRKLVTIALTPRNVTS